jgi:hypothetical protein
MPQPDDILDIRRLLNDLVSRVEVLEADNASKSSSISDLSRTDGGASYSEVGYNANKDAADAKINDILDALREQNIIES